MPRFEIITATEYATRMIIEAPTLAEAEARGENIAHDLVTHDAARVYHVGEYIYIDYDMGDTIVVFGELISDDQNG